MEKFMVIVLWCFNSVIEIVTGAQDINSEHSIWSRQHQKCDKTWPVYGVHCTNSFQFFFLSSGFMFHIFVWTNQFEFGKISSRKFLGNSTKRNLNKIRYHSGKTLKERFNFRVLLVLCTLLVILLDFHLCTFHTPTYTLYTPSSNMNYYIHNAFEWFSVIHTIWNNIISR